MSSCPTCNAQFERGEQFCPLDGSPLSPLSAEKRPGTDPLLGRVLQGRYRLTDRLGQGGMGTVYRAVHTLMDKPLAVKILRGELATDADAVARFHREARSASRLDHDHCIRVNDFGQTEDGLLYLAMELLEGRSLGQRIVESRMSVTEAASTAQAIALALEHAHEAGVIHRDLKPDNVFLAQRSRGREIVKVLDFGLAKLASDSGKSRSITRDGTIFGTPEYMAPEQAQGEALDNRTDLYSLGVLLYRLATGELPFRGDTFVAVLTKHVREAPRPPREVNPAIPPGLEAVILRCMEKRSADRYASASEVAEALAPLVPRRDNTGQTAQLRTVPPIVPPIAPVVAATSTESFDGELAPPRHTGARSLALVLVALVLAGGAAAWWSRRAPPSPLPTESAEVRQIRALVARGELDAAAAQIEVLHRQGESVVLERITAEVAERRGRRLEALSHLHRAKTLAPSDAVVRVDLAALLLRLGNRPDACRQAHRAEALASTTEDRTTLSAARATLRSAACTP